MAEGLCRCEGHRLAAHLSLLLVEVLSLHEESLHHLAVWLAPVVHETSVDPSRDRSLLHLLELLRLTLVCSPSWLLAILPAKRLLDQLLILELVKRHSYSVHEISGTEICTNMDFLRLLAIRITLIASDVRVIRMHL